MGGPQAAAVPHAAVGDAAPYLEDERDYLGTYSGPSVLPGSAGLEHWYYVPSLDLEDVWRNNYDGRCWYVYSNVTICKAVEYWEYTGPACVMVSA